MHPRKSTLSCSKREQRRRHPCNRRHTRAIAVRRLSSSRADRPRAHPGAPRRPHGRIPQRRGQVPRPGARGRPVPQHRGRSGGRTPASPPRAARRGGGGGPGRARAGERRAIVRGTPRHRGGPPASGAAEGLRTGCVRAPGPAGGTWTTGRASDRAARVRRPLCSRCRCAQTRASPPVCDQRGSRGERGYQVPKRAGNPRHLLPCAATDKRALSTWRGERRTGPRGPGRGGALRSDGACVRSLQPGDQHHAESST